MDIAVLIIDLLRRRMTDASLCPSEVARTLAAGNAPWRPLMQPVRDAAAALARADVIRITQGERTLDPGDIDRGPIRLRRGTAFPDA